MRTLIQIATAAQILPRVGTASSGGREIATSGLHVKAFAGQPLLQHLLTTSKRLVRSPPTFEATSFNRVDRGSRLDRLQRAIDHAAHLLPAQGPINVFIHHNTLHALEHLPFHQAVAQGAKTFGCNAYLSEDRYRQELKRGRIRDDDLEAVLRHDLAARADEPIHSVGRRIDLRLAMLRYPLRLAPSAELRWFIAETDALRRFRADAPEGMREHFLDATRHWVMRELRLTRSSSGKKRRCDRGGASERLLALLAQFDAESMERWSAATWETFTLQSLWRVARDGVHGVPLHAGQASIVVRHRDLLLEATGEDSDRLVHEVLIRFCAAFLDQGLSTSPLPHRELGFFRAFGALYRQPGGPPDAWRRGLSVELARLESTQTTPLDCIVESLDSLGIPEHQWEEFVTQTLLALRGWAGMIRQIEVRADRVVHPVPRGSLVEFLAVRLLLDRLALAYVAKTSLGFNGPLQKLRSALHSRIPKHKTIGVDQRAFLVFKLAQILGWTPADLHGLSKEEWGTLVEEIEIFPTLERQRVFHLAYERRYRIQTLDAIKVASSRCTTESDLPLFQAITCLDEREESFRRHLEELEPHVETFSAAGFFNIAMYYRGAADAHFTPLCPIVVQPQHWVTEEVAESLEDQHRRRTKARRMLGAVFHHFHQRSRTLTGGALLAPLLGGLATVPLLARVLFPRLTASIRRLCGRVLQPPPMTQLRLERSEPTPGPEDSGVGFTIAEMADRAERVLRDIGLTTSFSRLAFAIGHGSTSMNNPHESAHDCGACGGGRGGPNARAIAQMLNDPRVRFLLEERGIPIPNETIFIGAFHNTCDESITFFDLHQLPKSHTDDFEQARSIFEQACDRNAHERSRRFEAASFDLAGDAARRHVEGRAQDLAEVRPEYGHATNAVCVVGRRRRTRGLFMDRRTFLTSYDAAQDDDERSILTRILQAVFPVCAGINLEYYFSYVDPPGWGCGTKLPHNITSLLGVMDGAGSDLRSGLPWQMVEIHEPVRLLIVVETAPEAMMEIMRRQEAIGRLCRNEWVQLATLDPNSSEIHVFAKDHFEVYRPESIDLPQVKSSTDWYRGWRDHLGYAVIN